MGQDRCAVNLAIAQGLQEAGGELDARGVLLVPSLQATGDLGGEDPSLLRALRTLFRALPRRLAEGATLFVWSEDKAGGDIEVGWEARETSHRAPDDADAQQTLAAGPLGDLLDLAVEGLQQICRARLAQRAEAESVEQRGSSAFDFEPGVRRRFTILLPSRTNRVGSSR